MRQILQLLIFAMDDLEKERILIRNSPALISMLYFLNEHSKNPQDTYKVLKLVWLMLSYDRKFANRQI